MKSLLHVYLLTSLAVIAGGVAGYFVGYDHGWERAFKHFQQDYQPHANSFEDCVAQGYPVMESYPRQCRAEGETFVEQVAVPPTPTPANPPDRMAGCMPAGCSGVICADSRDAANIVTTCEYRVEYACYKSATCERQPSGECGWTQTATLKACLKNPPPLE